MEALLSILVSSIALASIMLAIDAERRMRRADRLRAESARVTRQAMEILARVRERA